MREGRRRMLVRLVAFLLVASLVLPLLAIQLSPQAEPVVVWHAFSEASVEAGVVRDHLRALAASRPKLRVEVRALGQWFGEALVQAIIGGTIPDIMLAPAEWVPVLDRIGLLATMPPDQFREYLPGVALSALSTGYVMGLPAFTSVVALARRPSGDGAGLDWPEDVPALVQAARDAAAAGQGGLYWPLEDLFFTAPWLLAAGGYVEPSADDASGAGGAAPPVVVDEAVLAWLQAVGQLRAIALPGPGETDLVSAWLSGEIAFAGVTPEDVVALRAAGARVEVGPIPAGQSYLQTWVWMLSGPVGEPRTDAIRLLVRIFAADDQPSLAVALGQLPTKANQFGAPQAVALGISGFRVSAETGLPMPAGSLAPELWALYETALQEYLSGAKAEAVLASLKSRAGELLAPEVEP